MDDADQPKSAKSIGLAWAYKAGNRKKRSQAKRAANAKRHAVTRRKKKAEQSWKTRRNNLAKRGLPRHPAPPTRIWYYVESPQGERYRVDQLAPFCREMSLDYEGMRLVCAGQKLAYKKWIGFKRREDSELIPKAERDALKLEAYRNSIAGQLSLIDALDLEPEE